ncbi:hypothetical protein RDABS01_009588 [Bienertia sinuspersici]
MAGKQYYLQATIIIIYISFSELTCCLSQPSNGQHNQEGKSYLKGMFVFGTSVVDNGNNNFIKGSLSKANYKPYGIDFPSGPTGRYCDGRNVADSVCHLLNLPLIPSFSDPNTKPNSVIHGVNYGSGGCGILDDTGSITGGVITMNQQIKNFEEVTLPELKKLLGNNSTEKLGQYLFMIAAGNNDFEMNYFLQKSSSRPSVPVFVNNLTSTFSNQLKRLYSVGARNLALLTVYPIGCTPVVMEETRSPKCVHLVNQAAHYFNVQLKLLLDDLKRKLPGFNFVLVNTYKIIRDIIKNPAARGFSNAASPCCELLKVKGAGLLCKEGGQVCSNRSSYVYFDGQHNTEAVNAIIAAKAFSSNRKSEVYPLNLQMLAQQGSN